MPISQDRMLELLNEAISFRDSFDNIKNLVEETIILHVEKNYNNSQAFEALSALKAELDARMNNECPRPIAEAIRLEKSHFDKNMRRNMEERERLRRRRILKDEKKLSPSSEINDEEMKAIREETNRRKIKPTPSPPPAAPSLEISEELKQKAANNPHKDLTI